jgi:hypothetical protein
MEILYTSKKLEVELVKDFLIQLFPERKVFFWDFISQEPSGWNNEDGRSIVFNLAFTPELVEFNYQLTIYRFPTAGENERSLFLGCKLSTLLGIEIHTSYQHPDDPQNPYYSILFNNGISYLVDDSNSDLGDGNGLPVKIISLSQVADYTFDSWGNLVQ